jgi:hypothetical protein
MTQRCAAAVCTHPVPVFEMTYGFEHRLEFANMGLPLRLDVSIYWCRRNCSRAVGDVRRPA